MSNEKVKRGRKKKQHAPIKKIVDKDGKFTLNFD